VPGCIYQEDGVIDQDHWRPARWARTIMEQEDE
jgi:hypothetical protein